MQIVNEDLLQYFREQRHCEYCGERIPGAEPHHLLCRGMGGGSRMDVLTNLMALCPPFHGRACHQRRHNGGIKQDALVEIVARREGVTPDDLMCGLWRLLRRPGRLTVEQKLSAEPCPTEMLVQWAEYYGYKYGLSNAWDRPWYWLGTIVTLLTCWPYACRCGKTGNAERVACNKPGEWLFIGQCVHCDAIAWAYYVGDSDDRACAE